MRCAVLLVILALIGCSSGPRPTVPPADSNAVGLEEVRIVAKGIE